MAVNAENVDDTFPDRLAAERLFDGHRLGRRGCAAVLRFDGFLRLIGGQFNHVGHVFMAMAASVF